MTAARALAADPPASLGGRQGDPEALTVRWYGTTNFELEFGDRVLLLDAFYERGPRTTDVGLRPDQLQRADLILVGHPHYDHIADAVAASEATGAKVVVHGVGADLLVEQGLSADRIERVAGRDDGEAFDFGDFSVRVLHGIHMQPDTNATGPSIVEVRAAWEADLPPLTPDEQAELDRILAKGSWAPEVFTEATLCFVIDVGGYRIVFRDSAGPISEEEDRWFSANQGCDLALVSYAGRPVARRQIGLTLPLVERYGPKMVLPCHHDDLYPYFLNMATEPLKMAVEDALPGSELLQPVYVEAIRIDMETGSRKDAA